MAIAIDGSTPASGTVAPGSTSTTSASFSPPNNSLIALFITSKGPGGVAHNITSVTNSGTALTWTRAVHANTVFTSLGGTAEVWVAQNPTSQTGITVTANYTSDTGGGIFKVLVLTGVDTVGVGFGATATQDNNAAGLFNQIVTTTRPGSWVWAVAENLTDSTVGTPGTGQTTDGTTGTSHVVMTGLTGAVIVRAPVGIPGPVSAAYDAAVTSLTNLQLWALLNEVSGTAITDSSSNHNTGTYSGSGIAYGVADGIGGVGSEANGITVSSGTAQFPHLSAYNLSTGATAWMIECDVKCNVSTGYPDMMVKGTSTSNGWEWFYDAVSQAVGFKINGVQYVQNPLPLTAWTNLAATWDGTTLAFWVNGVQQTASGNGTFTGVTTATVTDTGVLSVAGNGGGLSIAKIVLATAANTASVPTIYSALSGGTTGGGGIGGTHTVPSTPTIPSSEIATWGGVKVLMADDFNQPAGAGYASMSQYVTWGMAGQYYGQPGFCKQAESSSGNVKAAVYGQANMSFDGNSNLVMTANYVPNGVPGPYGTNFYTSGAWCTCPSSLSGSNGPGGGPGTASTGFAYYPAATELIIETRVNDPGLVAGAIQDAYMWTGLWHQNFPDSFEVDISESQGSMTARRLTVHAVDAEVATGNSNPTADHQLWPTQPAPGSWYTLTTHLFPSGVVKVFVNGVLTAQSLDANGNLRGCTVGSLPVWFQYQYGMQNSGPRNYYPSWTTDKAIFDYVAIYAPAGVSSSAYIGGGIASGTTLG